MSTNVRSRCSARRVSSRRRERRSSGRRERVVGRSCCRGAYLRGALLGAGSLSGPRDPHLELRTASLAGAGFIVDVAAREGVTMRSVERRNHAVAYAKGHEAIGDLLAIAGAGRVALALEEHAVVAGIRSRANRLANADEANLVRTARAAHRQLEAIRSLELDALPPQLAEIAELRLRHPSASLRELAAKARPPLTKAAAHRRLRASSASRKCELRLATALAMQLPRAIPILHLVAGPRSADGEYRPRSASHSRGRSSGGGGRPRSFLSGPPEIESRPLAIEVPIL